MVNKPKNNAFHKFLEKHKKAIIIYNVIVWSILILLGISLNQTSADRLTQEEMIEQVKEKCDNDLILPPNGVYSVKFNYNSLLNTTICEVLVK